MWSRIVHLEHQVFKVNFPSSAWFINRLLVDLRNYIIFTESIEVPLGITETEYLFGLQVKLFSIQKRCVRLLFGTGLTFDHPEYYLTCARARTYTEHTATNIFVLEHDEHTKPLLNTKGFLSLRNLYKYFTLIELFNILKYKCLISINELITPSI